MVRQALLLLLLISTAFPAFAAKRVSVEQLEDQLNVARQKSDGEVARLLSGLELTERASESRTAQWLSEFSGVHARESLIVLTDKSKFLDPPLSEMEPLPAPELNEQKRILSLGMQYANEVAHKLPNFQARRDTTHFEDNPSVEVPNFDMAGMVELSDYRPIHVAGKSNVLITYRDGQEELGKEAKTDKHSKPDRDSMSTNGEFGPLLLIVMGDATRNKVEWSYWERAATGTLAIFRYKVPNGASHYQMRLECQAQTHQQSSGYHGEIAIDSASGNILRLTAITEPDPHCRVTKAAIAVEYAPTVLGGNAYVCPSRSVSLSQSPATTSVPGQQNLVEPMKTHLNDVWFGEYKALGSDAPIVGIHGPETP